MIFIVYKELTIKQETKNLLDSQIKFWTNSIKRQELNLSIDVCWKNESTLIIIERWVSVEAYNNFIKTKDGKNLYESLNNYIDYTVRTEKMNTIS